MDWNRIFNPTVNNNSDRIELIKMVRIRYNLGLAEALRLVEELDREVEIQKVKHGSALHRVQE